jgi:hypothetical protein
MEVTGWLILVLLKTVIQLQMLRKIEIEKKIYRKDKMGIEKESTWFKVMPWLSCCLVVLSSYPVRVKDSSLFHIVQIGSGAH